MLVTPAILVPLVMAWLLTGATTATAFYEREIGYSFLVVANFLLITIAIVLAIIGAATM